MRNGRINGVFRDVTFHPGIIVVAFLLRQPAALLLHLVCRLPGADDHFPDAAHGLRVR